MEYNAQQTFNDFADAYLKSRDNEFNNLQTLNELSEIFPSWKERSVLELGCGGGKPILEFFSKKEAHVWGVDFSEKMIAAARENIPNSTLILGDMCEVELPLNYFDAVLSFYAIFVLPLEKQFALFEKIFDLLKPGGFTYFTLLSEAATKQEEFSGYLPFQGHQFYYAHTTQLKYTDKMKEIGFKDIMLEEKQIGKETCLWVFAKKD